MTEIKRKTVCVTGMHCPSCDILVQSKLEEVKGVRSVRADHTTQKAIIEFEGEFPEAEMQNQIKSFGYTIVEDEEIIKKEPLIKRITDAVVITMMLLIVYFILKDLDMVPEINLTTLSIGSAFFVGIIASLSTCMATTGALYLATIGKLQGAKRSIAPAISFNIGRIVTYTVMGAVNGYVGQLITKDLKMGSSLNIVIGILMVFVALDMLGILPFEKLVPGNWFKRFFISTQRRLTINPRKTSFFLGVITYWLPCGFTQSVQLYALSLADPLQGALIMLAFSLGTTPALLAIGYISSSMKSMYYSWFVKVIAVLVGLIGLSYIFNVLNLYNLNPLQNIVSSNVKGANAAEIQNGEQIIRMSVTNRGYEPANFSVEQGRPVKWIIEGKEVFGCQAFLQAPKIEVERVIKPGQNIISFLPQEKGTIGFSCSMGMYGGQIQVM